MAITHSTAVQNHGCSKMRSRVSSVFGGREVVRSGVNCEVILTIVTGQ